MDADPTPMVELLENTRRPAKAEPMASKDFAALRLWRGNLRKSLASRGILLRDASLELGHNKDWLSRALSGKADPSITTIVELCILYEIPMSELFPAGEKEVGYKSLLELEDSVSDERADIVSRITVNKSVE